MQRRRNPLVLTVSLVLLCAQAASPGDLTRGELRREDVVRIDVVGHGRSVGRLLGVEQNVVVLRIGRKVERVATTSVMRLWRDDGGSGTAGHTGLGVLAGLAAGGLVTVAMPSDEQPGYLSNGKRSITKIAVGGCVGAAVYYLVSSGVSGGSRHWTEVPVSELQALDAVPAVQELSVDPEPSPETSEPDATETAR
jgi:hypothetical protein